MAGFSGVNGLCQPCRDKLTADEAFNCTALHGIADWTCYDCHNRREFYVNDKGETKTKSCFFLRGSTKIEKAAYTAFASVYGKNTKISNGGHLVAAREKLEEETRTQSNDTQPTPSHNNTGVRIPTNEPEGDPPKRTLWVRLNSCIREVAESQTPKSQAIPPSITPHPADWSTSVNRPPTPPQSPAEALGASLDSNEAHLARPRKSPLSGTFHHDSDEDESIAIAPKRRRRLRQGLKRRSTSPIQAAEGVPDGVSRPPKSPEPAIQPAESDGRTPEMPETKPSPATEAEAEVGSGAGIAHSSPGVAIAAPPKRVKFPDTYLSDMLAASERTRRASTGAEMPGDGQSHAIDAQPTTRRASAIADSGRPQPSKYAFMNRPSGFAKRTASEPKAPPTRPLFSPRSPLPTRQMPPHLSLQGPHQHFLQPRPPPTQQPYPHFQQQAQHQFSAHQNYTQTFGPQPPQQPPQQFLQQPPQQFYQHHSLDGASGSPISPMTTSYPPVPQEPPALKQHLAETKLSIRTHPAGDIDLLVLRFGIFKQPARFLSKMAKVMGTKPEKLAEARVTFGWKAADDQDRVYVWRKGAGQADDLHEKVKRELTARFHQQGGFCEAKVEVGLFM